MSVDTINQEVEALVGLDLEGLRAEWRRRWGAPPKLRSRELMARAFAYRVQAEAFGDLAAPTKRRLAEMARRFNADRTYRPTPGPNLTVGCSLVREWGGVRHVVKVVEGGFSYQGEAFSSLSRLAEHITGAKRSGVLFFGLKAKDAARS